MSKSGTITPKQAQAITALLETKGVKEAAEKSGVPVRTVYRWLQTDTAFRDALSQAEGDMLDAALRRLLQLQDSALSALEYVLKARDTPPSARVAAAGRVLDGLLKLRDVRTIEERIAALEAARGDI